MIVIDMNRTKFSFLLILGLLLTACSEKVKVTVDNPLKEKLFIKVDGESFTLEGEKQKELLLKSGEHTFESQTEKGFLDKGSFRVQEKEGLLNVSHSPYILWKEIFSIYSPAEKSYNGLVREDTFEMEGKKYWGPFRYFAPENNTFIAKQWEYDVIQTLSETITIPQGEEYKIVSKLYRKAEFIENYRRQYVIDEEKVDKLMDEFLAKSLDSLDKVEKKHSHKSNANPQDSLNPQH